MKESLLEYIAKYNESSQVTIEYAVLEPFLNSAGNKIYNLHIVYSPKTEFLVKTYLNGVSSGQWSPNECIVSGIEITKVLKNFPLCTGYETHVDMPEIVSSSITQFVCSNMARFYNFRFNSPTDPFLFMFLEEDNIVYLSDEFKKYFFDHKESFKPHSLYMLEAMSVSLREALKNSNDYSYRSDKVKMETLLHNLHKTMRLYFIALRYYNTGELVSSFEEKYNLILNTLAQAARPWEFVEECIKFIEGVKQKELTNITGNQSYYQTPTAEFDMCINAVKERDLLKQQCFDFLSNRVKLEVLNS